MKKRITALLILAVLILSMALSLSSCGNEKYKSQESTAEEKRTVMTLTYDKEKYEVRYELYRAFFLQLKSSVDNGDNSVWTGPEKQSYINRIDALILDRVCEIYSVFHLCDKVGIDVYSNKIDKEIEKYIEVAVEGGTVGDVEFKGYGGDYDAYRADLKAMYLNDSVQQLLIRYSIALDKLNEHYVGSLDSENPKNGAITYTKEAVESFYFNSDEARRMLRVYLSADAFTRERAEQIRAGILSKEDSAAVTNYIIQFSTSGATDIKNGEVIGKYTLDRFYYSEITESLFSLNVGEVGEVISLNTDTLEGYTIVYRTDATEEHFEECYSEIVNVYLLNEAGKLMNEAATGLIEGASYTDTLKNLDRSMVSMN